MSLKIYDTASRKKVNFIPIDEKAVTMYVCGPTVYDNIHIGNARPLIVFDILYRLLMKIYGKKHIKYVRNITDVDDKINARASKNNETIAQLTSRTNEQFQKDATELGCMQPDVQPRATEHIAEMIILVERLIDNGYAYEADGHVLFRTTKWDQYGKFARKNQDELIAGARVEVASYKEQASDFVLWKPSLVGEDGVNVPGWQSPWGYGRPGWHLECSAMSEKHLGKNFDIHGGGLDLIFPHHQNEIAQSCCANPDAKFAKYWMHNGYLMSEGEKMSKSLGNFYSVNELLQDFHGEVLRLVILQTNYRAPLDFSKAKCLDAKAMLDKFYRVILDISQENNLGDIKPQASNNLMAALYDDLNTAKAMAAMHDALNSFHKAIKLEQKITAISHILGGGEILGILQQSPQNWFVDDKNDQASIEIKKLIEQRKLAKNNKDFANADIIRDKITAMGIILEDKPDGVTIWRKI